MKKLLLGTLLLSASQAFAFGVNLHEEGTMSVDQLVEMVADHVQCEQVEPRCILMGKGYGIQYPGQKVNEVTLTQTHNAAYSAQLLAKLKEDGFCK